MIFYIENNCFLFKTFLHLCQEKRMNSVDIIFVKRCEGGHVVMKKGAAAGALSVCLYETINTLKK